MIRFRSLSVALLLAASLGAAESTPPNIVFIISDDHAWTDYGFMGHPQIETPHLDKLAARSAVFTRGYVPTALCRPALATLATGLYAHQHKISGNDPARLPGIPSTARFPPDPHPKPARSIPFPPTRSREDSLRNWSDTFHRPLAEHDNARTTPETRPAATAVPRCFPSRAR